MEQPMAAPQPQEFETERHLLSDLGFFGHYLHMHAGGRSGKQHILRKLLHHQGHLTQRELWETTSISSAALSEVLAKLEAEGLVTRTRSATDQRQRDVALTEAGRAAAQQSSEDDKAFCEQAFAPLSAGERALLLSTLDRVRAHWEQMEEVGKDKEEVVAR